MIVEKWRMPWVSGFNNWVTTTFDNSGDALFKHQQLVKDFMQENSPFHGLLLYHGLGVGKTRSAIEIAKSNNRDIVVMLPASLKENFLGEIEKVADAKGSSFHFLSYNGVNRKNIKQYSENGFFDNKLVIIDEVHNFISGATGSGIIFKQLYQLLMDAKNIKIIALSGTPLINKPIEIGYLLNLLNGYIYSDVVKYIGYTDFKELEEKLLEIPNVSYCYINTELNTINLSYLPQGYVKDSEGFVCKDIAGKKKKSIDIIDLLKKGGLKIKSKKEVKATLLPIKEEEFENLFVDYDSTDVQNELLFSRRIGGLVSYFESYNSKDYPTQLPHKVVEVPMSKFHFGKYVNVREEEIEKEINAKKFRRVKNTDPTAEKSKKEEIKNGNVYRSFSRAICNFVFPSNIKRPYPSTLKFEVDDPSLVVEDESDKTGDWKDKKKLYEKKLSDALVKLQNESSKYLSMEGLVEYGPKMAAMIKNIEMSPGPVLVYSAFRNAEGLAIFGMALKENMGYEELTVKKKNGKWKLMCNDFNAPKYIIFTENRDETTILLNIFNSELEMVPDTIKDQLETLKIKTNLHGEFVKILMITKSGAEGISLKNVRQVHEMESHWNNIRSKQVRGRAIRAGSHLALPPSERKVETFLYMTVLDNQQILHPLIKSHDNGLTSDGYVYNIALRKETINEKFLNILQRNAIDCAVNTKAHNGRVKCFKPPHTKNNFVYYVGDISNDVLDRTILKSIKVKKEFKSLKLLHNDIELVVLTNPTSKESEEYFKLIDCKDECEGVKILPVYHKDNYKQLVGLMKVVPDKKKPNIKWIIKPATLVKMSS